MSGAFMEKCSTVFGGYSKKNFMPVFRDLQPCWAGNSI